MNLYEVTLQIAGPLHAKYRVWASSPEEAKRLVTEKLK